MVKVVIRWLALGAAVFIAGPVAASLLDAVPGPEGADDATALLSASPLQSVIATLGALLVALLVGGIAAKITTHRLGLFVAGVTLTWPAMVSGSTEEMIRLAQGSGPLWLLAIEGGLLGGLGVLIAFVITHAKVAADEPGPEEDSLRDDLTALVVVVAVGAVVAWLFAREGTKGQTVAAVGLAALAGATVARVVAPRCRYEALLGGMAILAAGGPVVGLALQGGEALVQSYANELTPLARPAPLAWLAGAFMGIPVGTTWASSMLESRRQPTPA